MLFQGWVLIRAALEVLCAEWLKVSFEVIMTATLHGSLMPANHPDSTVRYVAISIYGNVGECLCLCYVHERNNDHDRHVIAVYCNE